MYTGPVKASGGAMLDHATHQGWRLNFLIFGAVYVVATLCWLRIDATRPVVADHPG
jgi:hypothetical protein